jgi:hypothetical protein
MTEPQNQGLTNHWGRTVANAKSQSLTYVSGWDIGKYATSKRAGEVCTAQLDSRLRGTDETPESGVDDALPMPGDQKLGEHVTICGIGDNRAVVDFAVPSH